MRTIEDVVKLAKTRHGDKYDYSLVDKTGYSDNVTIICPIHGPFIQMLGRHTDGHGCQKCALDARVNSITGSTQSFIDKATKVHNGKYTYENVIYTRQRVKVSITCPVHGQFKQSPHEHLAGYGCKQCAVEATGKKHRMTKEEFVKRVTEIHKGKYDYTNTIFTTTKHHIFVKCPIHGEWETSPNSHLNGCGCPKCAYIEIGNKKRKSTDQFIEDSIIIHGHKYTYDNTEYTGVFNPVTVTCKEHGDFSIIANAFLCGTGCPECRPKKTRTYDDFIQSAYRIHGNTYDYSKVTFIDVFTKVEIVCKDHGVFSQQPRAHLAGQGCPECARVKIADSRRMTTDEFIERARSVHGDLYDYSKVIYKQTNERVEIICKEHGLFSQTPHLHVSHVCGCPICSASKGERAIQKYLQEHNISYISEFRFADCSHINTLPFDFCIQQNGSNFIIEYDGQHHFYPIDYFGGEEGFYKTRRNDAIKNAYCEEHNIPILRIPYWDRDNINTILDKEILHI